jgi:uncharacterized repeat protein (TIGR01451 family)
VSRIETNRWAGFSGAVLFVAAAGVVLREPGLIVAAGVGVGYLAAARIGSAPSATPALAVERTVDADDPDSGENVRVTVEVTNESETALFDLRLVDGVPPGLEVTGGSPRCATALSPGGSVRYDYTVAATRGRHEWTGLEAVTRNLSGSEERAKSIDVESTLSCVPPLGSTADLPLRGLTTRYTGRVSTEVGGPGVEFYALREYRRGDPLRRIDWNRTARTGELTTVQLREERAATVVLVVDGRESAYLARGPDAENAVERSVDAAGRTLFALLAGGDRVGLAGLRADGPWLSPGTGAEHRARARRMLATDPGFAPTPARSEGTTYVNRWIRRTRGRVPPDAQLILFSPLCDDAVARVARRFDADGHPVTVVSPDPTTRDTPGHGLAWIERRLRLSALRTAGLRVIEWGEEPLGVAVARAERRWSR